MFYQICLSPQVKRYAIITYKHGIYELPLELPSDLRLRIRRRGALAPTQEKKRHNLRKFGNIRKVPKPHRMIAQYPVSLPKSKFP